jgi:hypothetical protein
LSLFTIIPSNFFSILASKNKEIYAEALLLLHHSIEDNELLIKKRDFTRNLRDRLNELALNVDMEAEEEGDDDEIVNYSDKAAFIVRRLEECGWIDVEVNPDNFEEYIALPSYSINVISLLNELVKESTAEYVSLVHATYSELKLEDEMRDEFMYATLVRAFENTKRLNVELITLAHSIRIFQNRLGKVFSTNNILSDYFDIYKTRVSDRYYHPLKTFDSVAKFKRPILQILQKWLYEEDIRQQLVAQSLMWSRKKNAKEAEADIINKINYITDMYERVNETIGQIDQKHYEYTKASASKILYLNAADKSIKGHLDFIFKTYAETLSKGESVAPILNGINQTITFAQHGYVTPDSLTLPIIRQLRGESIPMSLTDFDDVRDMLMQGFLDETSNQFSNDAIFDFMDFAFGDESEVHISDIPLPSFDAFLLLILATIKTNDEECFYIVETDPGNVSSHGYRLPNLRFVRKELTL